MNMRTAVFPGSFDPLTNGHVDLIERALKLFDKVVVAVLNNPGKAALFTAEERLTIIRAQFRVYAGRVEARSFSGLLVDFVKKMDAGVIVRGLRAISDYDYEAQMALMNKNLCEEIETLFLTAREENSYVSSTLVKQVASLGGDVSRIVPAVVEAALKQKLQL